MAERPELLGLATNIVSAHVRHIAVAVDRLPGLIQQVFNALATAEQAVTAPSKAEPAVAVKRSIFADHVVCLDCGKHLTMLKRNLMTDHKLTPEQDPTALGVTIVIPFGLPELFQDPIHAREEVRAGSERVSRTEEDGAESGSHDGAERRIAPRALDTLMAARR